MKTKHKVLFFGFISFTLLVALSVANGAAKEINIGTTSGANWTALPFKVAVERNFFEKEGLRAKLIVFQGTNLMLTAMMAGELDYVTILPSIAGAAVRGLPVKVVASVAKASGYAIVAKPEINNLKALKGKRVAINSFGSAADFAVYTALSRNGLDPNRDVTLSAISGSPEARFAALMGGVVDAAVVSSPFEYKAEQKGFKTLLSVREMAELVSIPITGISVAQKKINKEPDEIVRVLRAVRAAILFLQSQREISVGLIEKTLKLDHAAAGRFYSLYREQYNPELTVPDSIVDEWVAMGTFRAKEKENKSVKVQTVYDWTFADKAK
ncbi:MAG: ABC transporter substrate-binding protein [Deltaproteobacteria bacterium]|nr:ABC transporter substrate-binding protein [Deltaproteobacteria bacterium]